MSLRDRISADINRCFMRQDHFGEIHFWNGIEIVCVPDDEEYLKRKNNNVNDISWDNNSRSFLIQTPLADFPGGKEPEPNTSIMFDKRRMYVVSVEHNIGVLDITLSARDPREII